MFIFMTGRRFRQVFSDVLFKHTVNVNSLFNAMEKRMSKALDELKTVNEQLVAAVARGTELNTQLLAATTRSNDTADTLIATFNDLYAKFNDLIDSGGASTIDLESLKQSLTNTLAAVDQQTQQNTNALAELNDQIRQNQEAVASATPKPTEPAPPEPVPGVPENPPENPPANPPA